MARRSSRGGKPEAREPKARSKKKSERVSVEVVEETGGVGFEGGIAIATTVILLIALLCVDALLGKFADGMFF